MMGACLPGGIKADLGEVRANPTRRLAAQTFRRPCSQSRMLSVTAVRVRGMDSRQMVRKSYPQSHTSLMDDVLVLFVCEYPEHARSVLEPVRTLLPLAHWTVLPAVARLGENGEERGLSPCPPLPYPGLSRHQQMRP